MKYLQITGLYDHDDTDGGRELFTIPGLEIERKRLDCRFANMAAR